MTTATSVGNNRITVSKEILLTLNIRTGNMVDIETIPDGSIRIFPKTLNTSDVAGILKTNVHSTIEKMDEVVMEVFRKSL